MAATGTAVLTGILINLVVALVCFIAFSILRVWSKAIKFYDPKTFNPDIKLKPAPLPGNALGWIKPVFQYSEPDVVRECGLDTAMYLRLMKYGLELFIGISIYCLALVLPVNYTDDEVQSLIDNPDNQFKFSNFDKLSLANINKGSPRMAVHLVGVYIITFMVLRLLWKFSKDSVLLRIQFLGNSRPSGATHSVLVTDVPAVMEATNAGEAERKKLEKQASEKERGGSGLKLTNLIPGMGGQAAANTDSESPETSAKQVVLDMPAEKSDAAKVSESTSGAAAGRSPRVSVTNNPLYGRDSSSSSSAIGATAATLRKRKVFNYDLNDTSLDPLVMAEAKLGQGATPQDLVRREFELVYGDQVETVEVVHDQSGLTKLVDEYNMRKQQLEDYMDGVKDRQTRNEPLPPAKVLLMFPDEWMKTKYGSGMFKKVDGLPFWRDRLLWLEQQILEQQEKARKLMWPSAFVTFKTRVAQSISATGLQHHDETTWRTRNAPEPRELIWSNLGMTSSMRTSKTIIWWVIFWLMTLFYMIPVAAIQGLIDVPKLAKVPGLKEFLNAPVIKQLIEAIVPGLVLKIFLALVPMILAAMMRASGAVSASEVDFGVVSRFFIFQCVVVFAGNTLGGSFFSQLKQWTEDPGSVISILGTAIPQAVTFFISFIWVSIGGYAISFLRIVGLVLYRVFTWLASSPRARDRIWQEQYTTYGTSVTPHTMTILLGLVFSLINPIITPTCLVYFIVANIVDKYNNIYVYRRNYESSGLLWVRVLNQVMTGLYIFQLVMIGLLGIKKFPYAPLIIPTIFAAIIFHISVLRLFARPWTIMSLHDAAELDMNDKSVDPETMEAPETVDPSEYVSPVFKVNKGDLSSLLAEASALEPVVAADVALREKEEAEKKANKKGCC